MEKDINIEKLILETRKISCRLMNLHKIYAFKLVNFDSKNQINNSYFSDVRKRRDVEDSKLLFGNILLRCESIIYAYIKMTSETVLPGGNHNKINYVKPFDSKLNRIYMQVSRTYLFIFDTIINQMISLYEYLANCCSYILIGQHARKFKWKKSIDEIRNKKYFELGSLLHQINNVFIDKLSEIRADIFHYNFLGLTSKFNHNIMNGEVEMQFKVDDKLQNFLQNSKLILDDSEKVEIKRASYLIIERGLELVIEILEKLKISIFSLNKTNLKPLKLSGEMFTSAGFNTLLDLQQSLLYHWGYFWDDIEQYEKLDYMNREMNKMFMPFRFYPED